MVNTFNTTSFCKQNEINIKLYILLTLAETEMIYPKNVRAQVAMDVT